MYLLDLPGFGSADEPDSVWTVEDYADSVRQFMIEQNLKDSIIIGHSFGGRVGVVLASKYPGFLKKLVLIGTPGIPVSISFKSKILRILARIYKAFGKVLFRGDDSKFQKLVQKRIYKKDFLGSSTMMKIRNLAVDFDLTPFLDKIIAPTQIIYGEQDEEYPDIVAKVMNNQIHDSRLSIISEAGHFVHYSHPVIVKNLIEDFINE